MAQLLVRDVDPKVVAKLKRRARENQRSLQAEVKRILEAEVYSMAEARAAADRIRKSLEGRHHTDSVRLLREDRDR